VALLRGINVGGRNKLPMKDLVAHLSEAGYDDVSTYIQSGNVFFARTGKPRDIESDLTRLIHERFGFDVPVVVQSQAEVAKVVAEAPAGFGDPEHRCDVIFLKHPLSAAEAMASMPTPREGVDQVWPGPGVIYFSRLDAQASKSRLSRITASPIYPSITIRNWNTTRKLHELLAI
jgi:uncharacterized protein (DUF1697 family)